MPCRAAVKLVGLGAAGPYTDLVAWAGSVDGQGQPAGGRHGLVFSPLVERSLSGVHPYSHLLPSWLATREVAVASWDLMQLTDDMDWEADFELPLYGKVSPKAACKVILQASILKVHAVCLLQHMTIPPCVVHCVAELEICTLQRHAKHV